MFLLGPISDEWQNTPLAFQGEFLMRAIVYRATNTVTGDQYIGHTRRTLSNRRKDHIRGALNGHAAGKLAEAIRCHGPEAFSWEEIGTFSSITKAFAEERVLIQSLRPALNDHRRIGPKKPRTVTRQQRDVLSQLGREQIQKWQQYAHLGPAALAREVVCLTDGGQVYASASAAAKAYNLANSAVVEVCLRKPYRYRARGHIFRYVDDCEGLDKALKAIADRRSQVKKDTTNLWRPVLCHNDGQRYPSASAASRAYGLTASSVSDVCRKRCSHSVGYKFSYCGPPQLPSTLPEPKGQMPTHIEHLPNEEWRRVSGNEERLAISNMGRVCSMDRVVPHRISGAMRKKGVLLKFYKDKDGYNVVSIRFGGKAQSTACRVHMLVAAAFIAPHPGNGMLVLHRNGVRDDNRSDNLYYGTAKDNSDDAVRHGTKIRGEKQWFSKLTESDVRAIRANADGISQYKLAQRYGVKRTHIQRVLNRTSWAHVK